MNTVEPPVVVRFVPRTPPSPATTTLIEGMEEAIFGSNDEYDSIRLLSAPRREGKTTAIAMVLSACVESYHPITVWLLGETSANRFEDKLRSMDCKIKISIAEHSSLELISVQEQTDIKGIHIFDDAWGISGDNPDAWRFIQRCDRAVLISTDHNIPYNPVIYLETYNPKRTTPWHRHWTMPSHAAKCPQCKIALDDK